MLKKISKLIRQTYDAVLQASKHRCALLFLALVSFVESSFFPIPPDIMLIPMILAAPRKAWRYAGICTLASVLGGFLGYFIGVYLFDIIAQPLLNFYGYMDKFQTFEEYYHHYGAWIVFGAGITPFPYKIITIASGAVHLNLAVFTVASVLARGIRFYIIAALLKKYGAPMQAFIEKNLGWLSILFLLLLIGGFALLKLL